MKITLVAVFMSYCGATPRITPVHVARSHASAQTAASIIALTHMPAKYTITRPPPSTLRLGNENLPREDVHGQPWPPSPPYASLMTLS
jgi:hypothetical protein